MSNWLSEINMGWSEIIKTAVAELEAIGKADQIVQVKEKFGGLRIYLNEYSDEINAIVRKAEKAAAQVCQMCGSNDEVKIRSTGGWCRAECEACDAERRKHYGR